MKNSPKWREQMSLFEKTGPWIAASLVAVSAVFGQSNRCPQKSFDQGHELVQSQMMPAYNAPARIDVRGSWDVYASGAFTYWQPIQDNMELGFVDNQTGGANLLNANIVNFDFDYKPGFQVGLGMNMDHGDWDSQALYSWYRGKHTTKTTLDRVNAPDTVLHPMQMFPAMTDTFYSGNESWKLRMDLLDWQLARNYYVGMKLSFRPFFAARAAWIRQNKVVSFNDNVNAQDQGFRVGQRSTSWGVGPRAGIGTNWMIGEGFRVFGNAGADILFTQYTKLRSNQSSLDAQGQIISGTTYIVKQNDLNTLRTHMDLEIGFGWGTYFDNNNWHVDLSAGYGFQVFFNQNVFRSFSSGTGTAVSESPNGNLYMHGLTATTRFDF